jgi:hypothetical protein
MFHASPKGSPNDTVPRDSIATECTDFIGPAGYGFVQGAHPLLPVILPSDVATAPVSPPQEHVTGDQWWTDYQPVSYILTSKRGDEAQFQKYASGFLMSVPVKLPESQHDYYLSRRRSQGFIRFSRLPKRQIVADFEFGQIRSSITWLEATPEMESQARRSRTTCIPVSTKTRYSRWLYLPVLF